MREKKETKTLILQWLCMLQLNRSKVFQRHPGEQGLGALRDLEEERAHQQGVKQHNQIHCRAQKTQAKHKELKEICKGSNGATPWLTAEEGLSYFPLAESEVPLVTKLQQPGFPRGLGKLILLGHSKFLPKARQEPGSVGQQYFWPLRELQGTWQHHATTSPPTKTFPQFRSFFFFFFPSHF